MKAIFSWFAFLFLVGCGGKSTETVDFQIVNPHDGIWQDSPGVPFRIVLDQTFGVEEEPEEAMLSSVRSVTTDGEGNVYVLDWRASQIVSFDSDGAFRWRVGREGEGPGELRQARRMIWDGDDHLYFANQQGGRIDILDLDGQFVRSQSLSEIGLTFVYLDGFLSPDRLVVTTPIWGAVGRSISILSIDDPWTVSSSFEIDHSDELDIPDHISSSPSMVVVDGESVVAHNVDYQLDFYNEFGQVTRIVTRDMNDLVRSGFWERGRAQGGRSFGGLNTPMNIQDGYWIVTASWPTNIDDPDEYAGLPPKQQYEIIMMATVDLFDDNWRLLYSWTELQENHLRFRNFVHADSRGRLYAEMQGDFPQVGRYRVEVSPPN